MSHSYQLIIFTSHSCYTHVTLLSVMSRLCHTLKSVMSQSCQSCHTNVTLSSQSCHTHVKLMSHLCHTLKSVMSHSCQTHVTLSHRTPAQSPHLFTIHPTGSRPTVPNWSHRYLVVNTATCKVEKGKADPSAAEGQGITEGDGHRHRQLVVLLRPRPLPNGEAILHK